jgi:hypothetical protein
MPKIVSQEEAETAEAVVCMRVGEGHEGLFADNMRGACSTCGHAIYFRPHNPQKPPRICMQCFEDLIKEIANG